jgi:coenzyme PQQ precursor peptide PqqA
MPCDRERRNAVHTYRLSLYHHETESIGTPLAVEHTPESTAFLNPTRRLTMAWTTPQYQDLRFGFEITMYISAR